MAQVQDSASPGAAISRRVRELETERLLRYNTSRRAVLVRGSAVGAWIAARVPPLARTYLETLLGSMIGFAVIAALASYVLGIRGVYTFALFGLVYALQSTYYKFRLAADPDYAIPTCKCAGTRVEGTEVVLRSRESALLGIPNSILAAGLYGILLALLVLGNDGPVLALAIVALGASAYLSYVMLVRIRSLCAICINIAALNILIFWQLLG